MTEWIAHLATDLPRSQVIDHRQVDWTKIKRTVYFLHQHLRYEYPGPIYDLQQRLMIVPPAEHGSQRLINYRIKVSSTDFTLMQSSDDFGNHAIQLHIPEIENAVDFTIEAWVERLATPFFQSGPSSWLLNRHWLEPSTLTCSNALLEETAQTMLKTGKQGLALAQEINHWTYERLLYTHDITSVKTTAVEALALGKGVCQDYAHVMLALCRLCGIAARYVSGHLLGEGGTHAWVEVILPGEGQAQVIPFDPTNDRQADLSYVTIAVGRDYLDVSPTSGTFRAAYGGHLKAEKQVGLTLFEYADTSQMKGV
ncbi:transglutaminase family protein [Tengunoibacter tsumagoiensis]|uniref:Transglutaminase n=1 Tax=Tengunoibacter tsumagoiensis TaxID=2014871 RepID=A0A402A6Q2_9CHLR|nr:transglutaminase family protein [Tengunoibacter tsumagoiensis]GCE14695.1 transglutaminase [Tengunoibacter tsumagoiensis]